MELILAHSNVSLYLGSANESASLLYVLAWGYYRKHFPHQNIYSHSSTLVHVIIRVCWPDKNLEQKLSRHFRNHFKKHYQYDQKHTDNVNCDCLCFRLSCPRWKHPKTLFIPKTLPKTKSKAILNQY